MNNPIIMHILQPQSTTRNNKLRLFLTEFSSLAHMIPQIASIDIVRGDIQILSVLEREMNIDQERMLQL